MSYSYSNLDRKNLSWFNEENHHLSLASMKIDGKIRSLGKCKINFRYPISAIVGVNGSGKSTFLALAACGFHNDDINFKLPTGRVGYYTFSDFFVQTKGESPASDIRVYYGIRFNNWSGGKAGLGYQLRQKLINGSWNDYSDRVRRKVLFFGFDRVAPHFERSNNVNIASNYLEFANPFQNEIITYASRILGIDYSKLFNLNYSNYSVPFVTSNDVNYSGFNMGTGELIVFQILNSLFVSGRNTLILIDEIELGLHEYAQINLINQLKILCEKMNCQVICTTHSKAILQSLPPEGRILVQSSKNKTVVNSNISTQYAVGKLGNRESNELTIFVEDKIAELILTSWLSFEVRKRVNVVQIGSYDLVKRQMAASYLISNLNCFCVLDGDQRIDYDKSIAKVVNYTGRSKSDEIKTIKEWISSRISFLPGDQEPEKWLIDTVIELVEHGNKAEELRKSLSIDEVETLLNFLKLARLAGPKNEFYQLSEMLNLDKSLTLHLIIIFVKRQLPNALSDVTQAITELLSSIN